VKRGIYPGSFDPPTLGHLDVIERASKLFDDLVIGIGVNAGKGGFLPVEERIKALEACTSHLPNVRVMDFNTLLVDFAKSIDATSVVRGLRAVSDFDYEFQIAIANRRMQPELDTVFLMTKWEYSYISSSVVREIARYGGPFETFVPAAVVPFVRAHMDAHPFAP
jgi:pantetheine-phosphate adenylyltransferase